MSAVFFSIFGHQNQGSGTGTDPYPESDSLEMLNPDPKHTLLANQVNMKHNINTELGKYGSSQKCRVGQAKTLVITTIVLLARQGSLNSASLSLIWRQIRWM
jgi:hypothetical protein